MVMMWDLVTRQRLVCERHQRCYIISYHEYIIGKVKVKIQSKAMSYLKACYRDQRVRLETRDIFLSPQLRGDVTPHCQGPTEVSRGVSAVGLFAVSNASNDIDWSEQF